MRFALDWRSPRTGSVQPAPGPRFLDYILDGESLYERLGWNFITPLGWLSDEQDERAAQRLLRNEAPDVDGRVAIYVCPSCAGLDCGAIAVRINRQGNDIVWDDWTSSSEWNGEWRHSPIDEVDGLRFPAHEYWLAITGRPRAAR